METIRGLYHMATFIVDLPTGTDPTVAGEERVQTWKPGQTGCEVLKRGEQIIGVVFPHQGKANYLIHVDAWGRTRTFKVLAYHSDQANDYVLTDDNTLKFPEPTDE